MINIKNLKKVYHLPNDTIIGLQDINLSVNKGEIFGVIGKSGAGKSTLIRCINLLEKPTKGKIYINDLEITRLSGDALRTERRKIGMIFQHFNLLTSKTVYENIALPLKLARKNKSEIENIIKPLLELTGLDTKRNIYPAQLSGGQQQRVAIARALANHPDVLLCDEATSSLDPHTTKNILNLLRDINKKLGLTILLITHEMSVVKEICHRIAVLEHGEIVETGGVLQIFTHPLHKVTRELISTALRLELPQSIKETLHLQAQPNTYPLIRFTFIGNTASTPFLSKLTEDLHLEFNILQANIELIDENPVGIMLIQAIVDDEQLIEILKYAGEQGLDIEVLGYVN